MQEQDTKPDLIEQYASAINASNLRVEADRSGQADILICAGWSASRIGAALMRLHTEFDSAARLHGKPSETDFILLMGKLKSLASVREQIAWQADKWGIERPNAVTLAVVLWWLDKNCHSCHGLKFERAPDAPVLTARHCRACRGEGELALPHGEAGKRLARWMDECVERARASIKNRLHGMR